MNDILYGVINEIDSISGSMGVGTEYYKGETGKSGADEVYIGAEPPTDPQVKLWVDTEDQNYAPVEWKDVKDKPEFATVATTGAYEDLENKPDLFSGDYEDLTNKPDLFDGDYNNLTNKPTIPEAYTLPVATSSTLGGVKVDGETITITDDGVISSSGGGSDIDLSNELIIGSNNKNTRLSKAIILGDSNNRNNNGGSLVNSMVIGESNSPAYYTANIYDSIICGSGNEGFPSKSIYNSLYLGQNIGRLGSYGAGTAMNNVLCGQWIAHQHDCSYAFGFGQFLTLYNNQFVIGQQAIPSADYRFIIGNGVIYGGKANALTVDSTGNLAIAGTMSSSGADYAEYFEWKDGNPEVEDRVGYIVALDGNKIVLANEGDYILGVVSGTATVLGDNAEWNWAKRWLTDDFGRVQYEDIVIHHEAEGEIPAYDETVSAPIVNPDYDPEQAYTKRADRPEWSAVGMMGKLYVRDDGTCQVNGYCKPVNGVATSSTTGMRVIERVSDNVIRVVLK